MILGPSKKEQKQRIDRALLRKSERTKYMCTAPLITSYKKKQREKETNIKGRTAPSTGPSKKHRETRQSKQCGFCIYIFDRSKSMVRLVRAEKMVLTGLVFARKIARIILIQNI